ncbi:hypothetical protein [Nonomuraea roseola]|uniref:Uncharacterized protein n=1 Tax=Nonomuraea roseola TaxID=46179 RepID=A0ABV5PWQ9_9ACTN
MTVNANPPRQARWDGWRRCAVIGTVTLVPTSVLAWVYVLSTYAFSRCLTYGEQCDLGSSGLLSLAWWAFCGSAAAGLLAIVLPARWQAMTWLRPALAVTQLLLQLVTFTAVVAAA